MVTKREKEIIYYALSRLLDDSKLEEKEFNEIDTLRDRFCPQNDHDHIEKEIAAGIIEMLKGWKL